MINGNSFFCARFRVESEKHRLIAKFDDARDAFDCATRGRKPRLLYRHNRPAGNCEGNYELINIYYPKVTSC
jgi:hypothetical protein